MRRCCAARPRRRPPSPISWFVDEAHWLADEDRGRAWTRLFLSGTHIDVHVCAAPEAEDLLRKQARPVSVHARPTGSSPPTCSSCSALTCRSALASTLKQRGW
ncbi:hypothetical protein ACFYWX_05180 [Streptomyces sp. NPDC002888]|uniref:hypothetical protein n=1 Tax=Streptomyces sp. NPDC002888 TaxID=3364668 RepID=UPI00369A8156